MAASLLKTIHGKWLLSFCDSMMSGITTGPSTFGSQIRLVASGSDTEDEGLCHGGSGRTRRSSPTCRKPSAFDSTSGGPNRRFLGLAAWLSAGGGSPLGAARLSSRTSSVAECCVVAMQMPYPPACLRPVFVSGAAVEDGLAQFRVRNSPWRLLLVHFCPSPVAVRHGESAVILLKNPSVKRVPPPSGLSRWLHLFIGPPCAWSFFTSPRRRRLERAGSSTEGPFSLDSG